MRSIHLGNGGNLDRLSDPSCMQYHAGSYRQSRGVVQAQNLRVKGQEGLRRLVAASDHHHTLSDLVSAHSFEGKRSRLAGDGRFDVDTFPLDGSNGRLDELAKRVWTDEEVITYFDGAASQDTRYDCAHKGDTEDVGDL